MENEPTPPPRDPRDAQDQEYKRAFDEWLAGMSPEEKKEAAALGITGPHIDAQGVGAPELDEARIVDESSTSPAYFDDEPEEIDVEEIVRKALARGMRKLVVEILQSDNARLTVECLALVTGIGYLGISETSIAKKFNVTRAAVSKRCVELTDKLGLPPAPGMRSTEARKSYRESRLRVVGES